MKYCWMTCDLGGLARIGMLTQIHSPRTGSRLGMPLLIALETRHAITTHLSRCDYAACLLVSTTLGHVLILVHSHGLLNNSDSLHVAVDLIDLNLLVLVLLVVLKETADLDKPVLGHFRDILQVVFDSDVLLKQIELNVLENAVQLVLLLSIIKIANFWSNLHGL